MVMRGVSHIPRPSISFADRGAAAFHSVTFFQ